MNEYETWKIKGNDVEYFEDGHLYLVNGILLPSITTILKTKFGKKYEGVNASTLSRAAELGTQMHLAIQKYEESGNESEMPELRNYKFLKRQYKWECLENEMPVILFKEDDPIACGRIDMIASIDGQLGIFDFKRTSALDKNYLAFQLNLYRIAYRQSYGIDATFLRGIHLREDVRKFVPIPVNEDMAWKLVDEYLEGKP